MAHPPDAVTEPGLQLAGRIDQAIRGMGSQD